MLVTGREQKLIQAFIKAKTLTLAEMLEITGTSRRTLYRDLEKLQETLPNGVSLRNSDEGYFLAGDLSSLAETHELLEFTVTERLYGELLLLLDNRASIVTLTETFGISQPTATSDLRLIEQALLENGLQLERERGLRVLGNEENIRSVLVSSCQSVSSISEALSGDFSENKILSLLDLEPFYQARTIFETVELPEMTDKTCVLMQFFLTATLFRLNKGYQLVSNSTRRPSKNALNFVQKLIAQLQGKFTFTIAEITYLAAVYDVLYFGFGREVLFMEKFDSGFSYKIRQLIDEVSSELSIEFSKDDRLYGLLYAHLKETDVLPELFSDKQNDFVKKIETDNDKIFKAVQQVLPDVFEKKFSSVEISFVTLHFVATLERSDLVLPLKTALVTSRGRISCEFIMSNLRKNFPFLNKIDIIQTSARFDKSQYDAIFTTEKEMDYIYVSRNLEQKNLDTIRHKLRSIQQNTRTVKSDNNEKNFVNLNQLFSIGNGILTDFTIREIENLPNLTDVVNQVVSFVNSSQTESLSQLLKKRFDETHLAIPDTKIALLHGVHDSIEKPSFQIFDLSQEVEVLAMNREKMKIKRVLLLLSPPDVADAAVYLLGKISSSIIENKLYTTIYNSGNFDVVSELLRQIITESIRKYGEQ
ncbi:BglG family transcription antiterminator [Lactococcus nasutitermitis]|uniref:BglG family transcription antiterminator n=1 Tax=Lactococcus nasutitermitis TaxID=1652957 RepID=A0ABV9JDV2_9LACT|nr:PRD domain-containing protein [Lactococcus nasutitermitis]